MSVINLAPSKAASTRWKKCGYCYPPEVIERVRRLRQIHSQQTVAEIVGVSREYVKDLERRGYQLKKPGRPLPPRPGDFAIQCNHMTILELRLHYGVHQGTIYKWLEGISRDYRRAPRGSKMKVA